MKRVLISALVLALFAGLVGAFAEGQSEDPDTLYGRGWRYDEAPELQEVSLTGRVYFEGLDFPVLKTDDGEFDLEGIVSDRVAGTARGRREEEAHGSQVDEQEASHVGSADGNGPQGIMSSSG